MVKWRERERKKIEDIILNQQNHFFSKKKIDEKNQPSTNSLDRRKNSFSSRKTCLFCSPPPPPPLSSLFAFKKKLQIDIFKKNTHAGHFFFCFVVSGHQHWIFEAQKKRFRRFEIEINQSILI